MTYFKTLAAAATLIVMTHDSASAASQFEKWWDSHEQVSSNIENLTQAKETAFTWYRIHKLGGYCADGNALSEESILSDANKASCCGQFPEGAISAIPVAAVTAMPWFPSIGKVAKERLWATLADEALAMSAEDLKTNLDQSTRQVQTSFVAVCLRMLESKYPD
jgi:hypothetical protein